MKIEIIKGTDNNPVAEFFSSSSTPETDAFAVKFKTLCGEKYWVPVDFASKLERERDEAREGLAEEIKFHHRTHSELVQAQCQLQNAIRERDFNL
jgi:hypothetical protein